MENKNVYQRRAGKYSVETVNALDETMGDKEIVKDFEYNLEGKKAGYFDTVVYNINALLKRHYAQKGVEGRDIWSKAYRHTVLIAASMSDVLLKTDEYDISGVSVLSHLTALAKAKKFAKIKLTSNFDIQFFDRNGNLLFEFNPRSLRKDQVVRTAREEIEERQEEQARIVQTAGKKEVASEAEPAFAPLIPPQISEIGQRADFSVLETVKLTGKPPRIIEDQFRDMDLCSGYAVGLLMQEYGQDAVSKAGLINYGRIVDAWDIKERGLRNDGVSVAASLLDTLVQKKSGKMDIADRNNYYDKLGNFYKNADEGNYPSLITAFQKNTHYTKQILEANEHRPERTKSMNSHVLVCLGRGPVNRDVVRGKMSLRYFLRSVPNVAYGLQRYLKVRVQKKNGDVIELHEDGMATMYKADGETIENIRMKDINVATGDQVEWQDVLVTDFYKGEERVMGLATYATSRNHVLMENFALKNVPKHEGGKYRAIDFVQIEKTGGSVGDQLKAKLGLSAKDLAYYLAALANSGVDLSGVAEKDLIPVFDMNDVRQKIDAEGGLARIHQRIVRENIERHNKGSLEDMFIEIKPGQTPWQTVESLFGDYFKGSYALTDAERNFVLKAIDESCTNIDLTSVPPHFEAGDSLYLTQERIFEVAKCVRERQAESFCGDDYVKIVQSGDSQYAFIRDCFDTEAKESQSDLHYSMLGSLERSYLLKALQACSSDVDLSALKAGSRLVLRRDDLQKCIKNIEKKRELQVSVEQPLMHVKKSKDDIEAAKHAKKLGFSDIDDAPYLETVVPKPIADRINEIYPGNSLKEVLVRNVLYFIFVNEQSRGGIRARVKKELSSFEESHVKLFPFPAQSGKRKYLISSIGPFQIRPVHKDLVACKDLFKKFGIKLPESFSEFRSMIKEDVNVSAMVAGHRILESLDSFENFMKASGEDNIDLLDENLTLMVATSYNRSPEAIYRAVFQNWAINLAGSAGVKSDVETGEVDSLLNEAGKKKMLETHVVDTFRRVVAKLIRDEKIKFTGDIETELQKIRSGKLAFVKGPLFQEMQKWHREKTGRGISFVFTKPEMERGKGVFSYGARLFSMPDQWASTFKDYGALHSLVEEMKGDYKPEPYSHPPVSIGSPMDRIGVEQKQKLERMLKESGISECYTKGHGLLTVFDRAVKLRTAPRGEKITSLYFGTVLKVEGIQQKGDEVWLKVRVAEGEKDGLDGYITFRKSWFSNENAPTITPRLTSRLKKLEENPDRPLPKDYIGTMNAYLRFLHNYNPEEPPKSAETMKRSRATAFEVQDKRVIDDVMATAKTYGYYGQRFFAILPKKGGDILRSQSLYVIDTANKRVLSFLVSTGRPGAETETPSGTYTASGTGLRALNYFGSHQGTYAQKYAGNRISQFQGSVEKYKKHPVLASMTTGLIPIQRRGEIVESAGRYFHGTNRENHLGSQASGGCVRMSNMDVVYLASILNGSAMEFQIIEDKVKSETMRPVGIELADASQAMDGARGKYRKTIRR
ncbi:MAG: L,D-transpeptidase [Candidatus Peregrinibacteria bacterium]